MDTAAHRPLRVRSALLAAVVLALGVVVGPVGPAAAADDRELRITGHGWGHGRGMGQWGSLGYAVDHGWGYRQVLDHFYGGTTLGTVPAQTISVELTKLNSTELRAIGRGLVIDGVVQPDRNADGSSVRVTTVNGQFVVQVAATCAAPGVQTWTTLKTTSSPVTISVTPGMGFGKLVRVCETGGERAYRGHLTVQKHAGTGVQTTFNQVSIEDYLRGVVPRESPDYWGGLGGGRGMEALKAQSVAARSYALSSSRASGAKTCDTTACQVYLGAAFQPWSQPQQVLDGPNANTAIDATTGQVRLKPSGAVARTEFSSSTGGYSAGGEFPAVVDDGDDYPGNPNHSWATTTTAGAAAAALGLPGLRSLSVTGRNGLGADGGRVTEVTAVDTSGATHRFSGNEIRSKLGLKSDWFTLTLNGMAQADAAALVDAVYLDLVRRAADPGGKAHWTGVVAQAGSVEPLATRLIETDERRAVVVGDAYRTYLEREPDAAGQRSWVDAMRAGLTVSEMQARVLGSREALGVLGAGDTRAWVSALYRLVLEREASPDEVEVWTQRVAGSDRASVALRILRSTEGSTVRLHGYYQELLGRDADPSGQAAFVPVLRAGDDPRVIIRLVRSAEYRSLVLGS